MSIEVSQCNPQERKHSGHFALWLGRHGFGGWILQAKYYVRSQGWIIAEQNKWQVNSGWIRAWQSIWYMILWLKSCSVFFRYSFFHYRFLSQVLIIALYNYVTWHHSAWGPKPWMINLEWSFSSSLGVPSLWRELQGARHAVSLMAETHTELLRLLLEQSRYFQF